jgi:hypothetical protein
MNDTTWKLFGTLVPIFGALALLWTTSIKELRRINYAEKTVGSLGGWFRAISRIPLWVINGVLLLFAAAAVMAFVGGLNKGSCPPANPVLWLCEWLFDGTLILIGFYLFFACIAYFQIFQRVLHFVGLTRFWIAPTLKYDPGMINADWLLQRGEDTRLININPTKCEILASFLFQIPLEKTRSEHAGKTWAAPDWPVANRANALLFGSIIEGVVHNLPDSAAARKIKWSKFYDRIRELGSDFWKPTELERRDAQNILEAIGKVEVPEPLPAMPQGGVQTVPKTEATEQQAALKALENEEAIAKALGKTRQLLSKKYRADASELALSTFSQKPSLHRARTNLQAFPQMNSATPSAMDVQFLKLAVGAEVWPTMKREAFAYPFSTGIAQLMMNTGCLVSSPDTTEVVMDEMFRRLLASSEQTVVDAVADVLDKKPHLAANLGISKPDDRWEISREVDYLLWWLSRRPRGWELDLSALEPSPATGEDVKPEPPWKLSGNVLVHG